MATQNAYSEKPVISYQRTTVDMKLVIAALQKMDLPVEVKRATYVIFRNESANGSRGINNNYCGFQADSGRWNKDFDSEIVGTVEVHENGTNRLRRFLAFKDFTTSVKFLANRVQARGLYVGGKTSKIVKMSVNNVLQLVTAYRKEWVTGDPKAAISPDQIANFTSMYNQARLYFV